MLIISHTPLEGPLPYPCAFGRSANPAVPCLFDECRYNVYCVNLLPRPMSARTLNLAKFIGLFEMTGGITAFILQGWAAYQMQVFTYQFPALLIAAALSFMAGLFLFNEERRGLILSFVLVLLQLIGFQTQTISYDLFVLPLLLDVRLIGLEGMLDLSWNISLFDTGLAIALDQAKQGWRITLHLVSVIVLLLLIKVWKEAEE